MTLVFHAQPPMNNQSHRLNLQYKNGNGVISTTSDVISSLSWRRPCRRSQHFRSAKKCYVRASCRSIWPRSRWLPPLKRKGHADDSVRLFPLTSPPVLARRSKVPPRPRRRVAIATAPPDTVHKRHDTTLYDMTRTATKQEGRDGKRRRAVRAVANKGGDAHTPASINKSRRLFCHTEGERVPGEDFTVLS